jgi:glutathione synthase/RimK-type ligase-like ATP-grasp enzyme
MAFRRHWRVNPTDLLVIAPPASRRVKALQASLLEHGLAPARVLAWTDVLTGEPIAKHVRKNSIVRIESPGEDWQTEKMILERGNCTDEDGTEYERLSRTEMQSLGFDTGRLLPSRQWYLGFRNAIEILKSQLLESPTHRLMNHSDEIAVMFDKRATHATLQAAGVNVPESLEPIQNFDDLIAKMQARAWTQVFVKLAHGSSASGAVALQISQNRIRAISTVEMGGARLYNSRKLITYNSISTVRKLIDALCKHRVHVERWLPKAGFEDRVFDLRVVVIGGKAQHVLVRLAQGPMTNLHLRNDRGDWERVLERIGEAAWSEARASCERALRCFPKSLYAGVDLMFTPGFRKHAILEVNAFGDYHRNVFVNGLDTYAAELEAMGVNVRTTGVAA